MSNKTGDTFRNKAAVISSKESLEKKLLEILRKTMEKEIFDAILIPMKVPAGDSFAYVLIRDKNLLKDASFFSPVMPVQGAKVLSSITRLGKGNMKIAAVMRPCEIRAAIELLKLNQVNLENITLISMDCPGVLPLSSFVDNPEKSLSLFNKALQNWDDKIMRPTCQICDKSNMITGDVHIGILGAKKDNFFLISNSQKGNKMMDELGLTLKENVLDDWRAKSEERSEEKHMKRKKAFKDLKSKIGNLDKLLDVFSKCINCHNCMRACPICYCRLCYFDSDKMKHPPEDYFERAERKGSMRFLPDTILFHIGRMTHMSLSCVSCGSCEDACPMSIPVAQIFSMVADETQGLFDYVSGRDIEEPIPLVTYKEEELHEVEDTHD